MNRLLNHALVALAGVSLIGVVATAVRFAEASQTVELAKARTASIAGEATEVVGLRSTVATLALAEPPQQDVLRRVRQLLSNSGLGEDRLASLASRADAAVPNTTGVRERTYTLTLDRMNAPLLGRFLADWSRSEPLWTVQEIELISGNGRQVDEAFPFRTTLQLSAKYAAEESR